MQYTLCTITAYCIKVTWHCSFIQFEMLIANYCILFFKIRGWYTVYTITACCNEVMWPSTIMCLIEMSILTYCILVHILPAIYLISISALLSRTLGFHQECVCASEVVRLSSDFAQFKSSHALSPSCIHSWLNIFVFSQNLQWARDVLLGSSVPWQQLKHMPAQGLFCERNKTNLFNVSHICMQLCLNVKVHRITATAWSSLEILVMCVYLAERVCCSYTCVMYAIMSSCDSVQ